MPVALIVGTRPEAIKLAPVARAMRRLPQTFDPVLLLSGRHAAARQTLAEFDLEPVEYRSFVALLGRAELILTDSGGIQEEAPSLGLPVLVLRERTERVEGLAEGHARCVGTDPERIVAAALEVLHRPARPRAPAGPRNPYGDWRAALRILSALGDPPPEPRPGAR